jgi:glutamine synthetase
MVGSEDSIGSPNTTLNAIVAEAFCEAADRLEGAKDFDMAVHDLIKEYMTEHQRIIFNGNGYAREWEEEAARRGLPNIPSMVAAVDTLTTPKAIHLFEKFGIFTEAELRSRAEVLYETYAKTINIEALTMVDMANKQIIPAVMKYSKSLADAVIAITEAGGDTYVPTRMLQQITQKLTEMEKASEALLEVEKKASAMERGKEQAFCYHDEVMVAMNALRKPADELEKLVDKKYWPFPTYADLLFEV